MIKSNTVSSKVLCLHALKTSLSTLFWCFAGFLAPKSDTSDTVDTFPYPRKGWELLPLKKEKKYQVE